MISTADISPDGQYRYQLVRHWDVTRRAISIVMLNPSTADWQLDDPTIRRCIGFAKREGYGGIAVYNLFGLRATKPVELTRHPDPIGPDNERHLRNLVHQGRPILCGWGADPIARSRAAFFIELARRHGCPLLCLGRTASGAPRHPLYLAQDTKLEEYP